jgi:hypothetical protein
MQYPNNLSEKAKYFHLLAEVCERLTPTHVDALVREGYSTTMALNNARTGKKQSIEDLIKLIEHAAIPGYVVPKELRPAGPHSPLFAHQLQE